MPKRQFFMNLQMLCDQLKLVNYDVLSTTNESANFYNRKKVLNWSSIQTYFCHTFALFSILTHLKSNEIILKQMLK